LNQFDAAVYPIEPGPIAPQKYFLLLRLLNGPADIHKANNGEYALGSFAFFFTKKR
jgi:hypothetical protein